MACWHQLLLLLFIALVVAEETKQEKSEEVASEDGSIEASPVAAALHRQKRHEVEIHRVIKRRPKLPPPPRGRKPRPPRRPGSKPRVKYGPPNINYQPLSHYVPQTIDDPFSSGFESSFADHHGSFGEPPAGYGPPIHPSPTFGSPPFAYGQTITSYEGSSFGKPSYEGSSFGKPSYEGSSFGKPSYEGHSFGKHGYHGSSLASSSSSASSFGKPSYESAGFDGSFSKASFGNGPSVFDSKVPSFADSSSNFNGFPGSKHSSNIGGYSHSFSHSSNKQPSFADSTSINTYTTPSGKGNYFSDVTSFSDIGSKHQLPLETYRKDPYKTPVSSYEVPSNPKSNLFEPSGDFDTSYKRAPHNGGGGGGGVSSTHSTSHSTSGSSEEEHYIPSLPTRYDQAQFHTPTKTNPNKPPGSTLQTISGDNDHFTSFTSYYDGASESQKIPVKSSQPPSFGQDAGDDHEYPSGGSGSKRTKSRRKKKPKFPGSPIAHNLDTDDLRDAFGSSSDFHQVAIDADEFLEFEPKKQIKHSKPAGVIVPRAEDSPPSNFVLLSSQNNNGAGGKGGQRDPSNKRAPPSSQVSATKSVEHDTKNYDLNNYFQANANNNQGHWPVQPNGQDDLNILSIQKSNSKSYYAGSSQASGHGSGFQPTRRRDMMHYRSAPSNLDYTMLDEDDDENYDEISDIGTRVRGSRKKKDLSEKPADGA